MPVRYLADMAAEVIDVELEIIAREREHPRRAAVSANANGRPLCRWGGSHNNLLEYFIGPQAAGVLQHPSGMPMDYSEAVVFLEQTFGVAFSNPCTSRAYVLERQGCTKFTDKMRKVLLLESEKQIDKPPHR